jgi:hypothetical protein
MSSVSSKIGHGTGLLGFQQLVWGLSSLIVLGLAKLGGRTA